MFSQNQNQCSQIMRKKILEIMKIYKNPKIQLMKKKLKNELNKF